MKISELKNAPEWLLNANTENADVEIDHFGAVIWKSGDFLWGDFRGGNFRGGNFRGGDFLGGNFLGGYFLGGNFLGGNFLGGNFLCGNFRGGNFRGGDFRGGNFLGGNFLGGNFLGGLMMPHCKWIYGQDCDGKIIIGCKTMSVREWTKWFQGKEEFETRRGTEEFNKIQACFEATKAYIKFMNKTKHLKK
jgi:uncharacterized protein YjbI with pentapeptide repeats